MKKTIFITLVILIGFGCTKLDEELYDKIPGDLYPENANQIANLTVDSYAKLRPLCDDEGWWFLAQEISSDEFCGPTRDADWYDGGKWVNVHRHQWTTDDESVNRMWDRFWQGITTCNQTLDILRTLAPSAALNAKIDEVEVMRSFYYYLLIDNYGDAPYLTSAANAPAQPFKIKREAIYDSIVATVESALPNLQKVNKKYLATRYMGFALLAKLYLNANQYKYGGGENWGPNNESLVKAGAYCDSIIAGPYNLSSNFLEPFLTNNENSPEIIFSIPYDENNFQGFRLHMRTLHYQMNLKYDMTVGPWNGLCVVPTFFDTYEDTDLRKTGYHIFGPQYDTKGDPIIDGLTQTPLIIDPYLPALVMTAANYTPAQIRMTGARVGKYEIKKGAKENLSNDFPLFRLTDFYMMKAEVEIRLGGNGDEWINPIRQRAGVSTWTSATLDQLLAERGRELYCEGHRRQDLIRYGKFLLAWWEKDVSSADRLTFPIPKWATDANPNLLVPPQ
jgi:hypothetical protein